MGILNLWRQFGRRYFWSHLLLGVVATGIGLPAILTAIVQNQNVPINASVAERQNQALTAFDNLFAFAQKNNHQRPSSSFSVNYWQQHAVRNVIRQLTFAFSTLESDSEEAKDPLQQAKLLKPQVMIDTLHAMLAQRPVQYEEPILKPFNIDSLQVVVCQPAMWVSQVHGIRAGPQRV